MLMLLSISLLFALRLCIFRVVKYFLQVPNLLNCSIGTYDVIQDFFIRDVESQFNVVPCPVHIRRPDVELIRYLSPLVKSQTTGQNWRINFIIRSSDLKLVQHTKLILEFPPQVQDPLLKSRLFIKGSSMLISCAQGVTYNGEFHFPTISKSIDLVGISKKILGDLHQNLRPRLIFLHLGNK